jgi:hypothetical protein
LVDRLKDTRLPDGSALFTEVRAKGDVVGDQPGQTTFPDLFFWPAPGVGLSMEGAQVVTATGRKRGEHRAEGVIAMTGEGASPLPETIWEVPSRILQLAGIDPAKWSPRSGGDLTSSTAITPEEQESIVEHLQGLGYVE